LFHAVSSFDSIGPINHLHESMAFVNIDDAGLDDAIGGKERSKMGFRGGNASNEQGPAENYKQV
jgi:hypothetical protein